MQPSPKGRLQFLQAAYTAGRMPARAMAQAAASGPAAECSHVSQVYTQAGAEQAAGCRSKAAQADVEEAEEQLPPPKEIDFDADISPEEMSFMQQMGIPFLFDTTQVRPFSRRADLQVPL